MTTTDMPKNVVNVLHPLPATEARYKVFVDGERKPVFTHKNSWHSFEQARQLKNSGKKVDVFGWDDKTGKHRPVSEYMEGVNEYGESNGDWYAVASGRIQRRNAKSGRATANGVVKDTQTIGYLSDMSNILASSASALRKGALTNRDIYVLQAKLTALAEHMDKKIDQDDKSLDTVSQEEIEL
jgi:hypothetical protein